MPMQLRLRLQFPPRSALSFPNYELLSGDKWLIWIRLEILKLLPSPGFLSQENCSLFVVSFFFAVQILLVLAGGSFLQYAVPLITSRV